MKWNKHCILPSQLFVWRRRRTSPLDRHPSFGWDLWFWISLKSYYIFFGPRTRGLSSRFVVLFLSFSTIVNMCWTPKKCYRPYCCISDLLYHVQSRFSVQVSTSLPIQIVHLLDDGEYKKSNGKIILRKECRTFTWKYLWSSPSLKNCPRPLFLPSLDDNLPKSLVRQSINSMLLSWTALNKFTPHVFFDTSGHGFTFPVARILAGTYSIQILNLMAWKTYE